MSYNNRLCECISWARIPDLPHGNHHHARCQKYQTEKFPYLMYYEEAIDAWTFAPVELGNIIDAESHFCAGDDEIVRISFKRADLTDAEVAALPEE